MMQGGNLPGYLLLGFEYGCKDSKDFTFPHNFLDMTGCNNQMKRDNVKQSLLTHTIMHATS